MHERIYSSKDYKISVYLKNLHGSNITIVNCLEIKSNKSILPLKGFRNSGCIYFPNIRLEDSDNQIYALSIEICNKSKVRSILNKILPTVFNTKYIRDKNIEYFLYNNRKVIIKMAINILGNNKNIRETWIIISKYRQQEILNNLPKMIKESVELSSDLTCDLTDDIFDDDFLLKSNDIIDF